MENITFKHNSWLKHRPVPSGELADDEKDFIEAGTEIYAIARDPELERGHLRITLSQGIGLNNVDGRNTIYLWPAHTDYVHAAPSAANGDKMPAASYTTISDEITHLMHTAEGYSDTVYLCPARLPTIGWGHMDESLRVGDKYSKEECIAFWDQDLDRFINGVGECLTVPVTHAQFSAVVSFAYNTGLAALRESTLLRLLNEGDYEAPRVQFMRWVRGGGGKLPGLVKRRWWECHLFYGGKFDAGKWDSFYPKNTDKYCCEELD